MTFRSAFVTTNERPIGRQPWDTTACNFTGPEMCSHAADDGHAGPVLVHPLQQKIGRKRKRLAEQHEERTGGPLAGQFIRPAFQRAALPRPLQRQVHWRNSHAGPAGQPQRQRRLLFDLAARADNRLAGAADDAGRAEQLACLPGQRVGSAGVVRRDEQQGHVRRALQLIAGGGDRLAQGRQSLRMRGESRGALQAGGRNGRHENNPAQNPKDKNDGRMIVARAANCHARSFKFYDQYLVPTHRVGTQLPTLRVQ
jgi:hypothetical protein